MCLSAGWIGDCRESVRVNEFKFLNFQFQTFEYFCKDSTRIWRFTLVIGAPAKPYLQKNRMICKHWLLNQ